MNKIKVVIVDDHKILRDGIKLMLNEMKNTELMGEASNGVEFLEILNNAKPDIVLLDINMPVMNGLEAAQKALKKYPDLNILVLSMYSDHNYYSSMIDLGVKGFLLKESDYGELERAINNIIEGKHYFSQDLLITILKTKNNPAPLIHITRREKEILEYICKGLSSQDIANKLFISVRTVEKHRSDLLVRTEMPNSISLVVYAIKTGMVTI